MVLIILTNVFLSIFASWSVFYIIPKVSTMFIQANLYGGDYCKKDKTIRVPESMGIVSATVFLIVMFTMIGVRFGQHFINLEDFPHNEFAEWMISILCICCMLLLGFVDDVLNLQWRYKLILPTIASLPLLMSYYINGGSTTIMVPKLLRKVFGQTFNIGCFYYVYMSLLSVFCTNAINIYAGINGLESGQAFIMSGSVAVYNLVEVGRQHPMSHFVSANLMIPFCATSFALFLHNRYPAKVFVGDTFTYFAGMTFAVAGIIGHYSKMVLLFFLPQIFNFVYSVPQLFNFIHCPRHRMPRYNPKTDKLEASFAEFKRKDTNPILLRAFRILHELRLCEFRDNIGEDGQYCCVNNLTFINLMLIWSGPLHESTLTNRLLLVQFFSSVVAFTVRFYLARLVF